jgi:hypothetical protein
MGDQKKNRDSSVNMEDENMICTEFTAADSSDTKGSPDPEIRKAVRDAIEAGLRDDTTFPVLSNVEGTRLRINIKIGPVEAVFEEDLEETFEAFLDPLVAERGAEMADLLEGLARRIRQADLVRRPSEPDGPA